MRQKLYYHRLIYILLLLFKPWVSFSQKKKKKSLGLLITLWLWQPMNIQGMLQSQGTIFASLFDKSKVTGDLS